MTIKPGDRVIHPRQREWGVGEVLAVGPGGKVRVHFVYKGELLLKGAPLEVVHGERAISPLLDNLTRRAPRKGVVRRTLPELIERFLRLFPLGFADPRYLDCERDYKVAARDLMLEILGREPLEQLVRAGDFAEVCARALRIDAATNLSFPNEKMALRDGLKSADGQRRFALALRDLLYGTGTEQARFEAWVDALGEIGAAKWPVASYFPFLARSDERVPIKPTTMQHAADVVGFELNYRPELNWLTYERAQKFAEILKAELASLAPRDMIDVQSFIWCIAPGKYD